MQTTRADETKDRLMGEFDTVVDQTEQLIKHLASAGGGEAAELRASVERTYAAATERLARMREQALGKAADAADATDVYVRGNPWQAIGMAAAASALAGLIVGVMISRR